MSNFLYLFWNKPVDRPPSPEQMEKLTKVWMKWMDDLRKNGHLVKAGERLDRSGKVVRGKAKVVTDGPYAEAKDTIGGYVIVQAKDIDEAVEVSKGCPIFDSDGMVEVRSIVSM